MYAIVQNMIYMKQMCLCLYYLYVHTYMKARKENKNK